MRAPNVRVIVAGLAAAAVFVDGSIATRNGPLGEGTDGAGDVAQTASASQVPAPTTPPLGLGTVDAEFATIFPRGTPRRPFLVLNDPSATTEQTLTAIFSLIRHLQPA